jgi:hypothetical protein
MRRSALAPHEFVTEQTAVLHIAKQFGRNARTQYLASSSRALTLKEMRMKLMVFMLGSVLMMSGGLARADDFGCTVLLCLANPAGPMAVSECVSPIKKLYRNLARGKAFPSCDMASASDAPAGKSWAQHGVSYYDRCPSGTTALDAGAYAVRSAASSTYYLGIGEGENPDSGDAGALRNKICVGRQIGERTLNMSEGEGMAPLAAGVFDQLIVIAPSAQPNYVDVYVDSAFSHRVRW